MCAAQSVSLCVDWGQVVRALLAAADGREGRLLPVARHLQMLWRADPALSHMEVYAPELVALLLLGPPQYAHSVLVPRTCMCARPLLVSVSL